MTTASLTDHASHAAQLEQQYGAHNYHPLPVTLVKGEGVWLWDDQGKRYLDCMSAYSAVSHGHCHPRLVNVAQAQIVQLNVTSRAFHSEWLGPFLAKACAMLGMDKALPMNTGAEAVETAIKAARKWAYTRKGVPDGLAEIIVMDGNFHGRTTTIVSFSTEPQYSYGFGPTTQGFRAVPFGDIEALNQAITPHTAAILLEPIQGEGGIIVPPQGWLTAVAQLCKQHNVLLLVDEIQTGLGRTGQLLACDYEAVKPDGLMLGKALGGGILAVSLFLARADVMDVFEAGDHGSTFGGNPLAARIGLEALHILEDEQLIQRAQQRGAYFVNKLHSLQHPAIKDIRGKGLLLGLELHRAYNARQLCENLLEQGLLTKDTHGTVIRLAPPLVIAETEIDYAVSMIEKALADMSGD